MSTAVTKVFMICTYAFFVCLIFTNSKYFSIVMENGALHYEQIVAYINFISSDAYKLLMSNFTLEIAFFTTLLM